MSGIDNPSEPDEFFVALSQDVSLLYVLRSSKCVGRLTAGQVAFRDSTLSVLDTQGRVIEYVSGANLTSWCFLGTQAPFLVGNWHHITADDLPIIMTSRFATALKETMASGSTHQLSKPEMMYISGKS